MCLLPCFQGDQYAIKCVLRKNVLLVHNIQAATHFIVLSARNLSLSNKTMDISNIFTQTQYSNVGISAETSLKHGFDQVCSQYSKRQK